MTRNPEACKRILRVRRLETRIATTRRSSAEAQLASLARIEERLDGLRSSLKPARGPVHAQWLVASTELTDRLNGSLRQVTQARDHAESATAAARSEAQRASAREDRTETAAAEAQAVLAQKAIQSAAPRLGRRAFDNFGEGR